MSTPDYYQFPYGIEPILISRHLTSNGGQILQYVARSTRLDGKNKHDIEGRISDLNKLIDLAYDEIDRLGEEAEEGERGAESFTVRLVEYNPEVLAKIWGEPARGCAATGQAAVDYSDAPYVADPLEDELWEEYFCGRKFRRLDDENAYEEETAYLTGGK